MITTPMDPERARWVGTGIPPRLRGLTLSDVEAMGPEHPQALQKARAYVDQYRSQQDRNWQLRPSNPSIYGQGLMFAGPPNTGKTTLAAAVLCELRRRWGVSVHQTRFSDHVERKVKLLGAGPDSDPEQLSRWNYSVERIEWADVVLLDDVGQERSTESKFAEDVLDKLLRTRFDEGLPTLITTNLGGEEWAQRYSKALRSFVDRCTRRSVFVGEPLRKAEV